MTKYDWYFPIKASRLIQIITAIAVMTVAAASAAPAVVRLRVQPDGSVDLGGKHFKDDAKLQIALEALADERPRPDVHLSASRTVRIERVGRVILMMQKLRLVGKAGFITEPRN